MKKLLLLFALFAVALSATASPTERWLDPECFAENRAPMRTSFIVFPTASEAVPENDYTRSPFYRTLNGEWAFLRAERPGAEPLSPQTTLTIKVLHARHPKRNPFLRPFWVLSFYLR